MTRDPVTTRRLNQRIAAVVGTIGGALGILVGIIQATLGTRIPTWTGNKADPVALGILTVVLSAVSLLSALALRRQPSMTPGGRLAAAAGLLIPGSLCFSTGGALWYLPGALLFTGGVYAVIAGDARRTREAVASTWTHLLVSVLGAFLLLMAVTAGPTVTIAVGVVSGLALMAAPWLPTSQTRWALLLVGTVPFAILTWWSVATPVVAVVAVAIGLVTFRRTDVATGVATVAVTRA